MTYPLLKALHATGAVLLLGNVVVTGFWALVFWRARDVVPFRTAARAIMWADYLFTIVGGTLLTMTGIAMTLRAGYRPLETPWLLQGMIALGVSMAVWILILLPDQWRMERIPPEDGARLRKVFLRWSVVGWADTALLFWGLWTMVAKP
jgi:uncharacterized membrane protein